METSLDIQSEIDLAAARLLEQPHVLAALVVSSDGLPVAAVTVDESVGDPDVWSAVSAALGGLANQLSRSLRQGSLKSAVFRAERRSFLIRPLAVGFLVIVTDGELSGPELAAATRDVERATRKLTGSGGR